MSSIISFDIYRQYFNSSATNSQLINCPGVVPLTLAILWDIQTKLAAIVSPIVGGQALEGSLDPSKEKSKDEGIVQITEWPSDDDDDNSSTTPSQLKTQRIADFYTKVAAGGGHFLGVPCADYDWVVSVVGW